jgi:hypothetical protein
MEYDQQFDLKDFILSTIRVYVNDIGTEKDTSERYFSIFKSIEDYKVKIIGGDLKNFLSEIQNVLLLEHDNNYRKNAGDFLLAILKFQGTIEFVIGCWNDYYLGIKKNTKKNPFQNDEVVDIKKSSIFYLYFDKINDEFADVQPFVCQSELLVGDILNFSDSEMLENLEFIYKTHLFKIVKREYSVEFEEMGLHLVPYSE